MTITPHRAAGTAERSARVPADAADKAHDAGFNVAVAGAVAFGVGSLLGVPYWHMLRNVDQSARAVDETATATGLGSAITMLSTTSCIFAGVQALGDDERPRVLTLMTGVAAGAVGAKLLRPIYSVTHSTAGAARPVAWGSNLRARFDRVALKTPWYLPKVEEAERRANRFLR